MANHGSLRLHVNGKEVSGGDNCNYHKGYLALESEGAPVEFRTLRIKALPSTGAGPEVTRLAVSYQVPASVETVSIATSLISARLTSSRTITAARSFACRSLRTRTRGIGTLRL